MSAQELARWWSWVWDVLQDSHHDRGNSIGEDRGSEDQWASRQGGGAWIHADPQGVLGAILPLVPAHRYMKYLYPYECEKRGLSNPNELQAAIDSNRREGRRQSFGGSLFAYSPGGAHSMLSSPKLPVSSLGLATSINSSSITPAPKVKKEEDVAIPITVPGRLPVSLVTQWWWPR